MTSSEAYKEYQRLADELGHPYLQPPGFLARYVGERLKWLREMAKTPETEFVRRDTAPFRQTVQVDGGALQNGLFNLSTLPEGVEVIRSVTADFGPDLSGTTLTGRACTPLSDDLASVAQADPFKAGDNWFPRYIETDGTLQILSATAPRRVTIGYWTTPPMPILTQTTASTLPESNTVVGEIIERVLKRTDLSTDENQRYQLTAGEILRRSQNP